MKKYIKLLKILGILILLLGIYIVIDNIRIQTTHYTILSDKINNDITIAQISDFHNDDCGDKLVKKISKEKPDIIVITGDFIDSQRCNVEICLELIKNIKDMAPIYYVTGNHESTRPSEYKELEKEMINLGVHVLHNSGEIIEINNEFINILGIDDPSFNSKKTIQEKISQINYDNEFFTLLLSHRPELFDEYIGNNIDLVLSGHAHGGQIRIPFIGGLYAPHQGIFPQYTSGIFTYNSDNMHMIVSRGIGNSRCPIRINNPSELVIIKIVKE